MSERKYGLIPSKPKPGELSFEKKALIVKSTKLPLVTTDLKKHLPKVINQENIGLCTGAGTTRALKTRMNATNYKWPFTPSALDLYAKVRTYEGTPLSEDSGASIPDIFKVLNSLGVCPEDSNPAWSWPFDLSKWNVDPPKACDDAALKHKLVKYMRVQNTSSSIKTALCMGLPLVIGIAVYESFESEKVAQTGIIPMPGLFDSLLGYHCMFLWGYGEKRADHVDGRNSWGTKWGDGGNFHIPMKFLCDQSLTTDIFAIDTLT